MDSHPMLEYDLHTHTTYSDGTDLRAMVDAAVDAGLSGIGVTDHCILVDDEFGRADRFDFDETYRDRRREIEALRDAYDIAIFDGVEISFVPAASERIAAFLEAAEFDYAIGSVHFADGYDFTTGAGTGDTRAARRAAVDRYFERQVALVNSGLFDVLAHPDLPNRLPGLRGLATADHYRALVDALETARTVPEINAGHCRRDYGEVHPNPEYLDLFEGQRFVPATDAHRPHEVAPRAAALAEIATTHDLEWHHPTARPA